MHGAPTSDDTPREEAQEQPRRPRAAQEAQEQPRRPRSNPGSPRTPQEAQEQPRRPRAAQEAQEQPRRPKSSPGGPRAAQEAQEHSWSHKISIDCLNMFVSICWCFFEYARDTFVSFVAACVD